ncbi:hypothetical protein SAMN02745108_02501 [Fibrobacter intestinalis]|uniref:Uncharacterized protein n=1 Tax=Fibrobacter intestinalis TaxID=28122 RepID=A0A1T4R1C3_9BACT|nr:hypothetical protein BGW94_0848 [Fibrobacter sp. NR9]SKA09675.1 hypothetical protein SAMN02745108_02501 [Fibrobacter intestinalis]
MNKSDSLFDSNGVKFNTNYRSNILKKENILSENYYLKTNFFAVNGIGYNSRNNAYDNFVTLFSFLRNELLLQFPEDTLSTSLVFNKTSKDIYTDAIQTLYLKMEELGLESYAVNFGYLAFLSAASFIAEHFPLPEDIAQKILEYEKFKDEIWMDITVSNKETENELNSALMQSVQDKSRAFVLGHSQGGMYTYKAFNSFPDSVREHFYSFNIAVPTDKNPDWFLANENDFIVNLARLAFSIPEGEPNCSDDGSDFGGESGHYHEWLKSYYNPHLLSYKKINTAIENAFRTVPYWGKEKKNAMYQLVWYNSAAQTTIEIAKADGSFATLGTYHGYHVTDPTIKTVPDVLLQDGVPVLRVKSYHHESWWGPYLSTDPGFFKIISNDDGSLTYLMSDAWSPYSYDDAELSIALTVE